MCAIVLGVANILATIFSNTFIDKLGRKILLYISSIGMIFSLGVFGAYFYLKDVETIQAPGWIPLIALMVYVVSFSLGYGPIPWLMMGEIFPSRIRGPAAAISTAFNWTCTFIVTKTFMGLQVRAHTKIPTFTHLHPLTSTFTHFHPFTESGCKRVKVGESGSFDPL